MTTIELTEAIDKAGMEDIISSMKNEIMIYGSINPSFYLAVRFRNEIKIKMLEGAHVFYQMGQRHLLLMVIQKAWDEIINRQLKGVQLCAVISVADSFVTTLEMPKDFKIENIKDIKLPIPSESANRKEVLVVFYNFANSAKVKTMPYRREGRKIIFDDSLLPDFKQAEALANFGNFGVNFPKVNEHNKNTIFFPEISE